MRIYFEGPFYSKSSLSIINRHLCSCFAAKSDLKIIPSDEDQDSGLLTGTGLEECILDKKDISLAPEPDITIRQKWPFDLDEKPKAKKWIQYLPWELGALPLSWVKVLREDVTRIWVHSAFVKDCLIKNGIDENKVDVVSPGILSGVFQPGAAPHELFSNDKRFKFLFVGGTISRKGIDLLINAYSSFAFNKNVVLIIKDYPVNSIYLNVSFREKIEKMKELHGMPDIVYLNDEMKDEEMAGLYTSCDCFVMPYRAEGFGMPILEALACGTPAIVTNYGACLDFCIEGPCRLVEAKVEVKKDKTLLDMETAVHPFYAEPDRMKLSQIMMDVYGNSTDIKKKALDYSSFLREKYAWEKVAEDAFQKVEKLANA